MSYLGVDSLFNNHLPSLFIPLLLPDIFYVLTLYKTPDLNFSWQKMDKQNPFCQLDNFVQGFSIIKNIDPLPFEFEIIHFY
ncbi:MAG: hypothetical protein DWQ02_08655 [Bacteroidetes bacterium]|nr:MAG: hypothetical protein DWQ02_08655 [Bacteroidota bacterium]